LHNRKPPGGNFIIRAEEPILRIATPTLPSIVQFSDLGTGNAPSLLGTPSGTEAARRSAIELFEGVSLVLFGFCNKMSCSHSASATAMYDSPRDEAAMNPSDPMELDLTGKDAGSKRRYRPPVCKKLDLVDVLKQCRSIAPVTDPVILNRSKQASLSAKKGSPKALHMPQITPIALVHELNNYLTIIVGECELLTSRLDEADALERVQRIKKTANRIAERIAARPSAPAVTHPNAT
jgi:hypothetical protein